jgi:trk system potassium uptake protein TrkH
MTAIATGGFSITDESIATYNSTLVEILIMVITIIGAIPFLIHYKILHGNWKAFFRDVQCKALILIAFIGILILALENYAYFGSALASFRYSAFQLVSGLTTTGFQTAPVYNWSPTAMIILAMIMVIGGAAGSTAGGMKLLRAVLSWKGMTLRIRKAITPSGVITCFKLGDERLSDEEANSVLGEATTIGLLWIFFLILGIVVMLHLVPPEFGLEDVIFEVASAQGNVGLSTGITGPELPAAAKIMLIFNMWIGRLEIIPVLLLFRSLIAGFKITSA